MAEDRVEIEHIRRMFHDDYLIVSADWSSILHPLITTKCSLIWRLESPNGISDWCFQTTVVTEYRQLTFLPYLSDEVDEGLGVAVRHVQADRVQLRECLAHGRELQNRIVANDSKFGKLLLTTVNLDVSRFFLT